MNAVGGRLAVAPGTRLRVPELLRARGWKPMDLVREAARKGHVLAVRTAYRLEDGDSGGVKLKTLDILADVFGVPVEALFTDEEESG